MQVWTQMKKGMAALALLLVVALPACAGDSATDVTPESAEKFAAQIRQIPDINGVDVFVGTARRYLFVDGSREDAITLSQVTVENTLLVVQTVSQGTFYFDLGKVTALNVRGDWLQLNF